MFLCSRDLGRFLWAELKPNLHLVLILGSAELAKHAPIKVLYPNCTTWAVRKSILLTNLTLKKTWFYTNRKQKQNAMIFKSFKPWIYSFVVKNQVFGFCLCNIWLLWILCQELHQVISHYYFFQQLFVSFNGAFADSHISRSILVNFLIHQKYFSSVF